MPAVRAKATEPSETQTVPAMPAAKTRAKQATSAETLLGRYLADLPGGLDAYPTTRASAVMVRNLIGDTRYAPRLGEGLPPVLEALVREPPGADAWIPVVHLCALHAATYDQWFASDGGLEAYEKWTFLRNMQLTDTPVYRQLLEQQSPEALLATYSTARWSFFYRGVALDVAHAEPGHVVLRLTYPPACWPEISRHAIGAAFRSTLVIAGATDPRVESRAVSSRVSTFALRWR